MRTLTLSRFLLAALFTAPAALGQTFSYDGNRWYEIEVSIFSNAGLASGDEQVIPEKTQLDYPDPIRELVPASSIFMVDFDALEAEPAPFSPRLPFGQEEEEEVIGPMPGDRDSSFRVTDFNRDPYIALGDEEAEFTDYNRDLIRSPDHRLLYHAVWRQPLLNRRQSTAIFVSGGARYGTHTELEGSLRFSYNVNRVDVEARLWLMEFGVPFPGREFRWRVPQRPFPIDADGAAMVMQFGVENLAYMEQVRAMVSNELHYLDHPDLGMLVEIRPYELPVPADLTLD